MRPPPKLGIIAGAGALPKLLMAAARESGRDPFVLGLTGFAETADSWIHLGEFGKGVDALHAAGVEELAMAGGVKRPAFSDLKTDLKGAAVLARIAGRAVMGDDSLLKALIAEFEREGFRVVGADTILSHLLAPAGPLGRHWPDEQAQADILRGLAAARALGAADRGQAVVVQQGAVLAEEDADGTDALIARAATLQREGAGGVLVKAKKPQQERRADLPTIGPATVENAARAGLRGIAVETGHSFILDRAGATARADDLGLFITGMS